MLSGSAQFFKRSGFQLYARNVDRNLALRHMSKTSSNHSHNNHAAVLASSPLPFSFPRNDEHEEKYHQHRQSKSYMTSSRSLDTPMMIHGRVITREYSVTTKSESATIALGLGAIAATAKATQYAVTAYKEWEKSLPEEKVNDDTADVGAGAGASSASGSSGASSSSSADTQGGDSKNIFSEFFSVGSKYYEGGFEDKMTLREAALILGVRESSTQKRIKEAHRRLLILNHPDTGGSTFLSGKLNEAKDLLLKSKGRKGR